jgi:hypothetical protein
MWKTESMTQNNLADENSTPTQPWHRRNNNTSQSELNILKQVFKALGSNLNYKF